MLGTGSYVPDLRRQTSKVLNGVGLGASARDVWKSYLSRLEPISNYQNLKTGKHQNLSDCQLSDSDNQINIKIYQNPYKYWCSSFPVQDAQLQSDSFYNMETIKVCSGPIKYFLAGCAAKCITKSEVAPCHLKIKQKVGECYPRFRVQ